MIEFNGYISGDAEKTWQHNNKIMGVKICVVSWLLIVPSIIAWGIRAQNWLLVGLCAATLFIFPLFALIPLSTKKGNSFLPKNIVIDEEYITCKTDKSGETKFIDDVKVVKDHGDFYEFVFPFGKVSTNFICQKDLLVKGTLTEFETLFKEKIQRANQETEQVQ